MFLIKVTPRSSFMRLRIISQINRADIENTKNEIEIAIEKCYKDSVFIRSNLKLYRVSYLS